MLFSLHHKQHFSFSVKVFTKNPTKLLKDVHFRLAADEPIQEKKCLSCPECDFESIYIPGFNIGDEFSYHATAPPTANLEPRPDDTFPWSEELSDKLSYEVVAQLSEKEQEGLMNTSELHANLHTSVEYK